MDERATEPVFFDAILRPNPPLSPTGVLVVLIAVAAANIGLGIFFILHGAWPIMPFMGLDVLFLAWAFRAVRRAAQASEHITLTMSELHITRQPFKGVPDEISLNPYWVRVALEDDVEPARKLTLWSHGRAIQLGAFLAPKDRASLAAALKDALSAAREFRPA